MTMTATSSPNSSIESESSQSTGGETSSTQSSSSYAPSSEVASSSATMETSSSSKPADSSIMSTSTFSSSTEVSQSVTSSSLSSSSGSPSPTSPPIVIPSLTSTTIESTSSASPIPSLCPAGNLTTYSDNGVNNYTIYCDMSSPGASRSIRLPNFVACIRACDQDATCTDVSYAGGMCYFALRPVRLRYSLGSQFAQRVVPDGASSPSSTATTLSSVSSSGQQPNPTSSLKPCVDGEILTGANGRRYAVSCSSDTTGELAGAFDEKVFQYGDFTQCANFCDSEILCEAWVWGGSGNAQGGGGMCYLVTT